MITLIMLVAFGVRGPFTGRFYLWGLMELVLELTLLFLWLGAK
jgi:hypothetical protein